ncbi:MAG TPA: 16S rRNA (adenine(1518)-N(6)/adenine(1519)-N(6))-dimethyltransferase RsmA [Polyangia bacterium]|nr:16S rRNA (adenine(1518)-N(6)/adenine(1519)-N(6))-dimethyltransferase RsmA [Polyangia bacterium]
MTPRELLRKYRLRAKKSWGQNFLVDERVYEHLVAACRLQPGDRVVEIGAGLGTLTRRLAASGAHVMAIERDRELAAVLRAELAGQAGIEIREANALGFDYAAAGARLIVVGNLPYQIATPILFELVAARARLVRAVVMLQLEMARRLAAQPATADYGRLTIALQTFCEVSLLEKVGRRAFLPPPRVDSAIVSIVPRPAPRAQIADPAAFERLVQAAFAQRRKTLRNALRGLVGEAAFARAGIDPGRRGETLSIEEFARLVAEAARA